MTLVFTTLSASVDGFVSGRGARAVAEVAGTDVKLAAGATATEALEVGLLDEIVINQGVTQLTYRVVK